MSQCDKCKYPYDIRKWPCEDCLQGDRFEPKPLTNADRIRAMTDEELASFACNRSCAYCPVVDCNGRMMTIGRDYCYKRWLEWLKQEVDE